MKTIVNSLLVALTLTLTSFSVAQADPNKPRKATTFQSSMYTTAEGKVQIAVRKETGNTVQVRLLNAKGSEVFNQQISKRQEAVRLRLDVSNLPDGIYQVAITNGVETTTQQLTLATQQPKPTDRLVAVH